MSKERLSKLQKWILAKLLESDDKCCDRIDLRTRYYCDVKKQGSMNCLEASLTRSIINLYFKGLIDVIGGRWTLQVAVRGKPPAKQIFPMLGRNIKCICLTDKGENIATKFFNVKK